MSQIDFSHPLCREGENHWTKILAEQTSFQIINEVSFSGVKLFALKKGSPAIRTNQGEPTYLALVNGIVWAFDSRDGAIRPSLLPPALAKALGLEEQVVTDAPRLQLSDSDKEEMQAYYAGEHWLDADNSKIHPLKYYLKFIQKLPSSVDDLAVTNGKYHLDRSFRVTLSLQAFQYYTDKANYHVYPILVKEMRIFINNMLKETNFNERAQAYISSLINPKLAAEAQTVILVSFQQYLQYLSMNKDSQDNQHVDIEDSFNAAIDLVAYFDPSSAAQLVLNMVELFANYPLNDVDYFHITANAVKAALFKTFSESQQEKFRLLLASFPEFEFHPAYSFYQGSLPLTINERELAERIASWLKSAAGRSEYAYVRNTYQGLLVNHPDLLQG